MEVSHVVPASMAFCWEIQWASWTQVSTAKSHKYEILTLKTHEGKTKQETKPTKNSTEITVQFFLWQKTKQIIGKWKVRMSTWTEGGTVSLWAQSVPSALKEQDLTHSECISINCKSQTRIIQQGVHSLVISGVCVQCALCPGGFKTERLVQSLQAACLHWGENTV